MKRHVMTVFSALMLVPGFASADLDALMQGCNDCHGDNGVSQWSDMPSIAGLPAITIEDSLFIYMDEARPCAESEYRQGDTSRAATTMCAVAADLSEDDIVELAEAYSALDFVPAAQEFDAAKAAAGEGIHAKNCSKCHSDAGMNPDDEAGILGGQQMGYLRNTFAQYMDGSREQPRKMQENLEALSADDVEALVHYYGSQQ